MKTRSILLMPALQPTLGIYLALIKFRLLSLVLVSTCMGYFLSRVPDTTLLTLLYTLLGVALVGGGANCLNQWKERDADALMLRTRTRPLVAGTITPRSTLIFGISITLAGLLVLGLLVNTLTLALGFLSWFSYLFLYTPLKRLSPLNTWVGAVPGALPAVLGCTAASGRLDSTALALFLLLYFWQMPHFFAISWVYRDDYLRGGFRMLSWNDMDGKATARQILLHSLLLVPVSLGLTFSGATGLAYFVIALLASLLLVWFALLFYREVGKAQAQRVFFYSIAYLPILFAGMVLDVLLSPT
jgi:heme o synthase